MSGGKILILPWGCGRVQQEGGRIEEIRPGEVAWFEPVEKHWHSASPTTAMSHIAVQEELDGTAVGWLEKVAYREHESGKGE